MEEDPIFEKMNDIDKKAGRLAVCFEMFTQSNDKKAMMIYTNFFNLFQNIYFIYKISNIEDKHLKLRILNLLKNDSNTIDIFINDVEEIKDLDFYKFLYGCNKELMIKRLKEKIDKSKDENVKFDELDLVLQTIEYDNYSEFYYNDKILKCLYFNISTDQVEDLYLGLEKYGRNSNDIFIFYHNYWEYVINKIKNNHNLLNDYFMHHFGETSYDIVKKFFNDKNINYPELTKSDDFNDFILRIQDENPVSK